jgi:uncharacterized membrane protein
MGKTSLGLEENVEGLLCYVLGWLTGIIFVVLEKENKFVRFHAFQSIAIFLILMVVGWIVGSLGFIFAILRVLVGILSFILWIILMWRAYKGEIYKLPIVGDWAEKQVQ